MATKRKSQMEKIIKRLANGKNLTVTEARNRFGVKNIYARIHELREVFGLAVYTNKVSVKGSNKKVTAYRLSDKFTTKALSLLNN